MRYSIALILAVLHDVAISVQVNDVHGFAIELGQSISVTIWHHLEHPQLLVIIFSLQAIQQGLLLLILIWLSDVMRWVFHLLQPKQLARLHSHLLSYLVLIL